MCSKLDLRYILLFIWYLTLSFLFLFTMRRPELIRNSLAGALSIGSFSFILVFGLWFCSIMPVLLLHSLFNWYSKRVQKPFIRKVLAISSLVFSVCAIIGFFLVANSVLLLLPGSSIAKSISSITIYSMYGYLLVYGAYIGFIAYEYIKPSITEDDGSSDLIRDRQLKRVAVM